MKVQELTIHQWQRFAEMYTPSGENKRTDMPVALRVENTIFTPARYFGGMKYNGATFTYFEPQDPKQPANADGSPYVAWLMVRDDFLRYVAKSLEESGDAQVFCSLAPERFCVCCELCGGIADGTEERGGEA